MAILVFLLKNRNEEIIYVEKKRSRDNENDDSDDHGDSGSTLSTSFLTDILKSEKDEQKILDKSLHGICKKLEAGIGVIYTYKKSEDKRLLELKSSYALSLGESQTISYELGEGLVGQAAKEQKGLIVDDIPQGYIKIVSGLGSASPTHLLIHPILSEEDLYGVIEIASFTPFDKNHEAFIHNCMTKIMEKLAPKAATSKKVSTAKETPKKETSKGKTKKA
ncbi:GAF domain-containing protein [Fulvivirga sp. RKSG066]|nr:GAF domain-containing protein [Fulvivirga aurantia]